MKWKIGDWCELAGVRYFVVLVRNVGPLDDGSSLSKERENICAVGFNFREDQISVFSNNPKLKHLPDCTGWDWQPSPVIGDEYVEVDSADAKDGDEVFYDGHWREFQPQYVHGNGRDKVWCRRKKLQLREGAWYERADGEIVGPCQRTDHRTSKWFLKGWVYCDDGTNSGRADVHIVREVPEPKPTYRPFANGSEYEPNFDRKIREKASDDDTKRHRMRVGSFSDVGIWIGGAMVTTSYEKAFDVLQFDDGTPFGIEVTK